MFWECNFDYNVNGKHAACPIMQQNKFIWNHITSYFAIDSNFPITHCMKVNLKLVKFLLDTSISFKLNPVHVDSCNADNVRMSTAFWMHFYFYPCFWLIWQSFEGIFLSCLATLASSVTAKYKQRTQKWKTWSIVTKQQDSLHCRNDKIIDEHLNQNHRWTP